MSSSENGKVIMVNDFVRLSNEFFGDGWEPTREMLASSVKEALNEIAGDDWELRHRCINSQATTNEVKITTA